MRMSLFDGAIAGFQLRFSPLH